MAEGNKQSLSAWAELLLTLDRELTEDELTRVKILVKDRMKQQDYERITKIADVIFLLEKRGFISENNVDYLRDVFIAANLHALNKELDSYEAVHEKIKRRKMAITKRKDVNEFVGREKEVDAITRLLENDNSPSLAVCITGPGGIGKTELAIEVCVRMDVRASRVDLRGLKTTKDAFLKLTNEVFDSVNPISKENFNDDVLQTRMKEFCKQQEVIVLLDNADDILTPDDSSGRNKLHSQREQFFTQLGGLIKSNVERGRINFIITSRYKIFKIEHFKEISLDNLTDKESVLFLYKCSSPGLTELSYLEARAIANLCDNNPLALKLIASRLRDGIQAADIIESLQSKKMRWLERPGEGSVKHTLQTTFELLSRDKQIELSKLSVFAGSFNNETAAAILGVNEPAIAQMIIDDLIRWNLINKIIDFDVNSVEKRGKFRYNMHLLIRSFLKEVGPDYVDNDVFESASRAFVRYFEKELWREAELSLNKNFAQSQLFLEREKANLFEYTKLSVQLEIIPPVQRKKDQHRLFSLLNFISDLFQNWKARAKYFKELAEKSKNVDVLAYCFLKTMEADQHFSANNCRSVGKILAGPSNTLEELSKTDNSPGVRLALAGLYYVKGRYLAESGDFIGGTELLRSSLKTRQELFGVNTLTVRTLNMLGYVYHNNERVDQALEYYTQAYEMAKKLNKNHPDFPMILSNIGNCHLERGYSQTNSLLHEDAKKSYDTAISFYLEAIKSEKDMKIYSVTHRTAYVLKSKALAHIELKEYDVAMGLAKDALDLRLVKLGRDHRETGRCIFLVGHIYFQKGLEKYAKERKLAQELFGEGLPHLEEAFRIEVKLGQGCHTNNYESLQEDLCRTLRLLEREGDAQDYERRFEEAEKILPPEYVSSSGSSDSEMEVETRSHKSTSTSASEDENEQMET